MKKRQCREGAEITHCYLNESSSRVKNHWFYYSRFQDEEQSENENSIKFVSKWRIVPLLQTSQIDHFAFAYLHPLTADESGIKYPSRNKRSTDCDTK